MKHQEHAPRFGSDFLRDAVITLVAVVVAVLALDDITTDTASSFTFERMILAGCAAWFMVVGFRLVRRGHRALGGLSLGLVVLGGLAQRAINPGTVPSLRFEYLATVGGLLWFVVLAGILTWFAWRSRRGYAA